MNSILTKALSDIVAPYPGEPTLSARADAALTLAVDEPQLPRAVADAIGSFLACADMQRLLEVQKAVAQARLLGIGVSSHVHLVARLVNSGLLNNDEAASILAALPHVERRQLSPAFLYLVEIADAVVEDAKDAVMAVDDDRLFADAVQRVLSDEGVIR